MPLPLRTCIIAVLALGIATSCVDRRQHQIDREAELRKGVAPTIQQRHLNPHSNGKNHHWSKIDLSKKSSANINDDIDDTPEIKVAVLLPLTGKSAEIGKSLLDAAKLALFDKYATLPRNKRFVKIVLLPKDTEASAKIAKVVAQDAINEGAKIIIGPLFSDAVTAVSSVAAKHNINMLTFSNNVDVAQDGVYLLGFMPDQQVNRVLDEAYSKNIKNIALLAPNNEYGHIVASTFRRSMVINSKSISGIELYSSSARDVDIEIQKILRGRSKEADSSDEIEAILIADGGAKLESIVSRLNDFGVSQRTLQLLGTGLWHSSSIIGSPKLIGGWFPAAPLNSYLGFERRFLNYYDYTPHPISGISYDAVTLVIALANRAGSPRFGKEYITAKRGFRGAASGLFRCYDNGICKRNMAILQVGREKFRELAPAARFFGD